MSVQKTASGRHRATVQHPDTGAGHKDGGRLVMRLYRHPDAAINRQRLRDAAAAHNGVTSIEEHRRRRAG